MHEQDACTPTKQTLSLSDQKFLVPTDNDNVTPVSNSLISAICSVGTIESPHQSRQLSPIASLCENLSEFEQKHHSDENQFEIEWANLSLKRQKKWYHKLNLGSLFVSKVRVNHKYGTAQSQMLDKSQKFDRQEHNLILNNLDGRIRSGEITAILGPSGAGKTSLLNCLFGKYRTSVHGSIRVTGASSKKHLIVSTIPQIDYLIGHLSTEEALWFASRLKNCKDNFNHDKNIERVIELLGLQQCRHTLINKLSGGQYKRISIAQEMLSSPDVLVLDEPTSGLDSLTCYRTIKVLRNLVERSNTHNEVNPMSIIITIHQPHREVLDLFHSMYVMAVGGQALFQGPPSKMKQYISEHSGIMMPACGYNPASLMIELASGEYGRKPIEALVLRQRLQFKESTKHVYHYDFSNINATNNINTFDTHPSKKNISDSCVNQCEIIKNNANVSFVPNLNQSKLDKKKNNFTTITLYPFDEEAKPQHSSDHFVNLDSTVTTPKDIDSQIMTSRIGKNSDGVFWRHVSLISKRCFLSNNRDPMMFIFRVGVHILIPIAIALIYGPLMGIPNNCLTYKPEINLFEYAKIGSVESQKKKDDIRVQYQNVGLHLIVNFAFGVSMIAITAVSFPLIMHNLIKEIRNGWYSLGTFLFGKMLAELPLVIILPPISVAIIYVMTGQPSSYLQWRYLIQSLVLVLIIMIAEAKGLIFGAIFMNSMPTAVFVGSISAVPFLLISGYLIRIRDLPYILQYLAGFSYFKQAIEALIITRYGFGMCPCDPESIHVGGTPRIIGIPHQIMSLTDYYMSSIEASTENLTAKDTGATDETNIVGNNRNTSRIVRSIRTLSPEIDKVESVKSNSSSRIRRWAKQLVGLSNTPNITPTTTTAAETSAIETLTATTTTTTSTTTSTTFAPTTELEEDVKPTTQGFFFERLATLLAQANSFGFNIESCDDVQPFTMRDMKLKDWMLAPLIGYMFIYIVILKLISYFIVEACVKLKL